MNTKTIIFAGITCCLLTACAVTPNPTELSQVQQAAMPSVKAAQADVKNYFDNRLIDPESARYQFRPLKRGFSDLAIGRRSAGVFMCGTVNSKNRLGGYTGQTPFIAYFNPVSTKPEAVLLGDEGADYMIAKACRDVYGY